MNELLTDNIKENMLVIPDYNKDILAGTKEQRLLALADIYKLFIPLQDNAEKIYTNLYLSCRQSLDRKQNNEFLGVNNSMSMSVLGTAGVGKTSLIHRTINLIGNDLVEINTNDNTYKAIPFLVVEMPINSIKALLYNIVEKVDEILGTMYSKMINSKKYTIDQLINLVVATICKNYVGVLIIDEIQNLLEYKSLTTNSVINMLVSISNSGCTVIMVGMNEIQQFFSQKNHLARRSIPLQIEPFSFNEEWENLSIEMLKLAYAPVDLELNYNIFQWFFNHTNGIPALLQELWYKANLSAVNTNTTINIPLLKKVFYEMTTIHRYIHPAKSPVPIQAKQQNHTETTPAVKALEDFDLVDMVNKCKKDSSLDIWTLIQEKVRVIRI